MDYQFLVYYPSSLPFCLITETLPERGSQKHCYWCGESYTLIDATFLDSHLDIQIIFFSALLFPQAEFLVFKKVICFIYLFILSLNFLFTYFLFFIYFFFPMAILVFYPIENEN